MSNELLAAWQKMGIKTNLPPSKSEKAPAYVPTLSKPSPPKKTQGEARKTGTDEMKEVMAKKQVQQEGPEPKAQTKKTYLDEMKETMAANQNSKAEGPFKAKEPMKRKTYLEEMKENMDKKNEAPI